MRTSIYLVFALIAAFQAGVQNQSTPQVATGSIEGMILHAGSTEPIGDVGVTLTVDTLANATTSVLTDAKGHFLFADVPPGKYAVVAQRDGYFRNGSGAGPLNRASVQTVLEPGGLVTDLRIYLVGTGIISGKVFNSRGMPAVNVKVEAVEKATINGKPTLVNSGAGNTSVSSQTDDRGEYRLSSILPGIYYVRAEAPSALAPRVAGGRGAISPTDLFPDQLYFPATRDIFAATTVHVRQNEEIADINFNLPMPNARYTISGSIHDDSAQTPQPRMSFYVVNRSPIAATNGTPRVSPVTFDPTTGKFSIPGIPPGEYEVFAVAQRAPNLFDSGNATVEVTSHDVSNMDIVIRKGVDIHGRLRVNGEPPKGKAGNTMIGLSSMSGLPASAMRVGGSNPGAVIDRETGEFTLLNVPAGAYRFRTMTVLPADTYIADVQFGEKSVYGSEFVVEPGATDTMLVDFRTPGNTLRGLATDSENHPAPGAVVVLVPEPSDRLKERRYVSAQTDQNGHFVLSSIAPGEYKLFAWDFVTTSAWQNSDFVSKYESNGKTIKIGNGTNFEMTVTVSPTSKELP